MYRFASTPAYLAVWAAVLHVFTLSGCCSLFRRHPSPFIRPHVRLGGKHAQRSAAVQGQLRHNPRCRATFPPRRDSFGLSRALSCPVLLFYFISFISFSYFKIVLVVWEGKFFNRTRLLFATHKARLWNNFAVFFSVFLKCVNHFNG